MVRSLNKTSDAEREERIACVYFRALTTACCKYIVCSFGICPVLCSEHARMLPFAILSSMRVCVIHLIISVKKKDEEGVHSLQCMRVTSLPVAATPAGSVKAIIVDDLLAIDPHLRTVIRLGTKPVNTVRANTKVP